MNAKERLTNAFSKANVPLNKKNLDLYIEYRAKQMAVSKEAAMRWALKTGSHGDVSVAFTTELVDQFGKLAVN